MENLGQLPRRLKKAELSLLASKVCIQVGHPFVIFGQSSLLDLLQRGPALIVLGLFDLEVFLGQLQIEACHLVVGVELTQAVGFLLDLRANLLPLVADCLLRLV